MQPGDSRPGAYPDTCLAHNSLPRALTVASLWATQTAASLTAPKSRDWPLAGAQERHHLKRQTRAGKWASGCQMLAAHPTCVPHGSGKCSGRVPLWKSGGRKEMGIFLALATQFADLSVPQFPYPLPPKDRMQMCMAAFPMLPSREARSKPQARPPPPREHSARSPSLVV